MYAGVPQASVDLRARGLDDSAESVETLTRAVRDAVAAAIARCGSNSGDLSGAPARSSPGSSGWQLIPLVVLAEENQLGDSAMAALVDLAIDELSSQCYLRIARLHMNKVSPWQLLWTLSLMCVCVCVHRLAIKALPPWPVCSAKHRHQWRSYICRTIT